MHFIWENESFDNASATQKRLVYFLDREKFDTIILICTQVVDTYEQFPDWSPQCHGAALRVYELSSSNLGKVWLFVSCGTLVAPWFHAHEYADVHIPFTYTAYALLSTWLLDFPVTHTYKHINSKETLRVLSLSHLGFPPSVTFSFSSRLMFRPLESRQL